jgi:biotin operon repressor
MANQQRRTRRVLVRLSDDTFASLEALAERLGGLSHSAIVSLAISKLVHTEGLKKKQPAGEAR